MRRCVLLLTLVFVIALSGCNLGASDPEPTNEPLVSPTPAGTPSVTINSPRDGEEFVVNDPLFVEATVTDSVGVSTVQLLANNQPVRTISLEGTGNTFAEPVLDFTPRTTGQVQLSVVAFRGTVASDPASVTVTVRDSQAQVTATARPGDINPIVDPNDPNCRALVNTNLNFRRGPGTNFSVIRVLGAGEVLPAVGRLADTSWWQLRDRNGTTGWVSANFVTMYDGTINLCRNVSVVASPSTPTPQVQPTNTPLPPTQTPVPTAAPTNTPVPPPNLTVSRIVGPDTLTIPSGESEVTEEYSINITNVGGSLNEQFSVSARVVGGDTFDVGTFGNLGANQSLSQTVEITFGSTGQQTLIVTVDSDDDIEEGDEDDNERFIIVTVSSSP
ncbi:MAG: SH3 domain-containing protein [Chloroflexota bacterium]